MQNHPRTPPEDVSLNTESPVHAERDALDLKGKVITITGGTGSFGSTLLNFLVKSDIEKIKIFSRDENKQDDLRKKIRSSKVEFYIGDIRQRDSLYRCIAGSDYVFHAAALKQVPSCEFFPFEAVQTNIVGSQNVLDVSRSLNVAKVVMLSTDKAVMPINAMGISKAMMEKLTFTYGFNYNNGVSTVFNVTRYGNVMGSRGSVIPLFISALLNGDELTVTDLRMTRFMMTLNESVDLVLFALRHGRQGELFVQKAPAATIETLLCALELVFNRKVRTKIIGFRHAEKLHETLLSSEEASRADDLGEYFRVRPDVRTLDYTQSDSMTSRAEPLAFESNNTTLLDPSQLAQLLRRQDFVQHALVDG